MKIKDLKWNKNTELSRAAALGASGHYLIEAVEGGGYESRFVANDTEFKYVSEFLGHTAEFDNAVALCNAHHAKRVTEKYLVEDE